MLARPCSQHACFPTLFRGGRARPTLGVLAREGTPGPGNEGAQPWKWGRTWACGNARRSNSPPVPESCPGRAGGWPPARPRAPPTPSPLTRRPVPARPSPRTAGRRVGRASTPSRPAPSRSGTAAKDRPRRRTREPSRSGRRTSRAGRPTPRRRRPRGTAFRNSPPTSAGVSRSRPGTRRPASGFGSGARSPSARTRRSAPTPAGGPRRTGGRPTSAGRPARCPTHRPSWTSSTPRT